MPVGTVDLDQSKLKKDCFMKIPNFHKTALNMPNGLKGLPKFFKRIILKWTLSNFCTLFLKRLSEAAPLSQFSQQQKDM